MIKNIDLTDIDNLDMNANEGEAIISLDHMLEVANYGACPQSHPFASNEAVHTADMDLYFTDFGSDLL